MSHQTQDDLNYMRWLLALARSYFERVHPGQRGYDLAQAWSEEWGKWVTNTIFGPVEKELGFPIKEWEQWRMVPRHHYLKTVAYLLDEIEKLYGPLGRQFAEESKTSSGD